MSVPLSLEDDPLPLSLEEGIWSEKEDLGQYLFTIKLQPDSEFTFMPIFLLHDKIVDCRGTNFKVIAVRDGGIPPTRELDVVKI